ncbi:DETOXIFICATION 16-like isoform X3 [Chlorella sorokiniana]|uniref:DETOXIFICATION 16-like isoform X3 n=1 Tax=Chlorella sorokiniana TaxID=3076 RepID=A0A2P6TUQ2_CHLSO|nr:DETOXIFICATION 16-like isoform X3 [Chlorella sorokiniana]|eukprot:PRW57795.1 DETOXIFICATION 16-like isoform X3 [Chlorella sorokiniana]
MTGASAPELREPLLATVRVEDGDGGDCEAQLPSLSAEMKLQARMALPLAVGHITNWLLAVISLAFVGHIGRAKLAAATLAQTLYNLICKVLMAGMLGMLDTYASQAVGAGNYSSLGSLWRHLDGRAVHATEPHPHRPALFLSLLAVAKPCYAALQKG